jgi:hypothetical protein
MFVKKIFASTNDLVNQNPLFGWMLLVIFMSCTVVTTYQTAYHFGKFLAMLTT